jgi:spore coat polysaccharide biosynthesis protein SpsF (cytidylyltransferase family)
MKIIADTNTFIAVALNEPEKDLIIRLTGSCDLVSPEVLHKIRLKNCHRI